MIKPKKKRSEKVNKLTDVKNHTRDGFEQISSMPWLNNIEFPSRLDTK